MYEWNIYFDLILGLWLDETIHFVFFCSVSLVCFDGLISFVNDIIMKRYDFIRGCEGKGIKGKMKKIRN